MKSEEQKSVNVPAMTPENSLKESGKKEPTEESRVKTIDFVVEKSYGFLWIIKYTNLRVFVNRTPKSKPVAEHSLWYFWSAFQDKFASGDLQLNGKVTVGKEEHDSQEKTTPVEHAAKDLTFDTVTDVKTLTVNNFSSEFKECIDSADMTAKFQNGKWNKKVYSFDLNLLCKENKVKSLLKEGVKKVVDQMMLKNNNEPIEFSSNPQSQVINNLKQQPMFQEEVHESFIPSNLESKQDNELVSSIKDDSFVQNNSQLIQNSPKKVTASLIQDKLNNYVHDQFHNEDIHPTMNKKISQVNDLIVEESPKKVTASLIQDKLNNYVHDQFHNEDIHPTINQKNSQLNESLEESYKFDDLNKSSKIKFIL